MRAETAAFLAKARLFLSKAEGMLAGGWPDEAGRSAYLAGFHAAQALICERSGKFVKTHSGVQATFARLVRDEISFDLELRRFLGRGYNLKTMADYDVGPDAHVTADRARAALGTAGRFVAAVAGLLDATGQETIKDQGNDDQ